MSDRNDWIRQWTHEQGVLHLCQVVHMQTTGASDALPGDLYDLARTGLALRLAEWREPTRAYDRAVMVLIETVLDEATAKDDPRDAIQQWRDWFKSVGGEEVLREREAELEERGRVDSAARGES